MAKKKAPTLTELISTLTADNAAKDRLISALTENSATLANQCDERDRRIEELEAALRDGIHIITALISKLCDKVVTLETKLAAVEAERGGLKTKLNYAESETKNFKSCWDAACNDIAAVEAERDRLREENVELRKVADYAVVLNRSLYDLQESIKHRPDEVVPELAALRTELTALREAAKVAKKLVRNARGAIESGQLTDKDVRGTLMRCERELQAALAPAENLAPTESNGAMLQSGKAIFGLRDKKDF